MTDGKLSADLWNRRGMTWHNSPADPRSRTESLLPVISGGFSYVHVYGGGGLNDRSGYCALNGK